MHNHDQLARPHRLLAGAIVVLLLAGPVALAEAAHVRSDVVEGPRVERPAPARLRATALDAPVVTVAAPSAPPTSAPPTSAPPTSAPPTSAPPRSTPPTTTTAAAPPPTAAPAPLPPAPVTPPPPPASPVDPMARLQAIYEQSVPAGWRGAIAVRLDLITGGTSWAHADGLIQIGSDHARTDSVLRASIAHEFGHLIAFHYGSQAFDGAAPEGWPAYSGLPTEAWADCVSRAFTGVDDPSHGLPSCAGESLAWTASWLGSGPSAHLRTWD